MKEVTTASLERSLQNFSLNHHQSNGGSGGCGVLGGREERSSSSDDQNHPHGSDDTTALELNSHVSLPYHWEQCLDLKTGEIYYVNWTNGMKAKEDPRKTQEYNGDYYYSEDDSSYDSEESSSESSLSSPSRNQQHCNDNHPTEDNYRQEQVLVVGGCKSCLMYFMVPKQVDDCPKCGRQLIHFDKSSENGSP